MLMPGRKYSAGNSYRYGFNGKENDNEVKGEGNQQDYGERIYDPRIGKFLSVDPITAKYPELTPYQFASNRPIDGIDLDGLEFLKDFNSRQNKYFQGQQDVLLKPKETVKAFDPSHKSMTQSWRDSKNFFANITYSMTNSLYTFGQQLPSGVTASQIQIIGRNCYRKWSIVAGKDIELKLY
jgi:RHS repeat-associated protein